MSTWQQRGVLAPVQSWDPDFSFLTQVSNLSQARFDKGFNQVKSVYNSLLNSPLTNEGNIAYRDEMFKRLDETLKKNSALDFSKADNVAHVIGLLDPLTKDKDFAYDVAVTKFHGQEKSRMESYRTSEDPEKRKLYNDYAKAGIGMAERNLAMANRGDGSIQKVAPQDFVEFEDINEYLNKAAKDQGLIIQESTTDPSGYIVTDTNGKKAVPIFTAWAQAQMGNKFDRQLRLQSKVMGETQIQTKMDAAGISRDDAIMRLSEEQTGGLTNSTTTNVKDLTTNLKEIDSEINILEKYYSEGIPSNNPGLKERYDHLLEQQEIHKKLISGGTTTLKRINDEGIQYMASNMNSIIYDNVKQQTALGWGATRAMTTAEREIKADQVQITKWNNDLKIKMHQDDMMYKAANLKLDQEKLAYDYWKEMQPGSGAASKSKKSGEPVGTGANTLLGEEQMIDFIGYNVAGSKAKTDILKQRMNNNYTKMFDAVTQADNGLMQLILPEEELNSSLHTMHKIKQMADGKQGITFTDAEQKFIVRYGDEIGTPLRPQYLTSQNQAKKTLQVIASGSYEAANKKLKQYASTGTLTHKVGKDLNAFQDTYNALRDVMQDEDAINRSVSNIAKVISQSPEDLFEGAKIVGYQAGTNTPVYDLSKVSPEGKAQLDNVIAKEFDALTTPVGNRYSMSGLTAGQVDAIINEGVTTMYDEDGKAVTQSEVFGDITKFNNKDIADLFGDGMQLEYDPVKEVVGIKLNIATNSGIAKQQKIKAGEYRLELPYGTVRANAQSLPQIYKGLSSNSASAGGAGAMSAFLENPYSNVKSESFYDNAGFSYDIQGANFKDGYGLNITTRVWDGIDREYKTNTTKFPIADPSDPTAWNKVNDAIGYEFTKFMITQGRIKEIENELEKILLK